MYKVSQCEMVLFSSDTRSGENNKESRIVLIVDSFNHEIHREEDVTKLEKRLSSRPITATTLGCLAA
jgi:hypothetical protein